MSAESKQDKAQPQTGVEDKSLAPGEDKGDPTAPKPGPRPASPASPAEPELADPIVRFKLAHGLGAKRPGDVIEVKASEARSYTRAGYGEQV